jgi:hypothetical protein
MSRVQFQVNRYDYSLYTVDGEYIGPISRKKFDKFIKVDIVDKIDDNKIKYKVAHETVHKGPYIEYHQVCDRRQNKCTICGCEFTPLQRTNVFKIIPSALKSHLPHDDMQKITHDKVIMCNRHQEEYTSYNRNLIHSLCEKYEIDPDIFKIDLSAINGLINVAHSYQQMKKH